MRIGTRIAIGAALIGVALFFAYQFYDRQFKLGNIVVDWPAEETSQEVDGRFPPLHEILDQPFDYLDRGKQSYVFISKDKKFVLKLFDTRCLRSGALPFLFSIDEEQCKKKLRRLVKGYQTAGKYENGSNGIVYMQLAPNPAIHETVILHDRFGIIHKIDLAKVPFVLQQKAIPLRELITDLLNKGDVEGAKKNLRKIFDMYVEGYRKGVYDRDHNFMYNTGFIGEQPIRIDVGRLKYSEAIMDDKVYILDLEKIAVNRLGDWLHRHFPKYRDEIVADSKLKLKTIAEYKDVKSSVHD